MMSVAADEITSCNSGCSYKGVLMLNRLCYPKVFRRIYVTGAGE